MIQILLVWVIILIRDLQLEDIIKIVQKLPWLIMDKMSGIELHF